MDIADLLRKVKESGKVITFILPFVSFSICIVSFYKFIDLSLSDFPENDFLRMIIWY